MKKRRIFVMASFKEFFNTASPGSNGEFLAKVMEKAKKEQCRTESWLSTEAATVVTPRLTGKRSSLWWMTSAMAAAWILIVGAVVAFNALQPEVAEHHDPNMADRLTSIITNANSPDIVTAQAGVTSEPFPRVDLTAPAETGADTPNTNTPAQSAANIPAATTSEAVIAAPLANTDTPANTNAPTSDWIPPICTSIIPAHIQLGMDSPAEDLVPEFKVFTNQAGVYAAAVNYGITNKSLRELIESGEIPGDTTHLNLTGNQISDISPLKQLANLEVLILSSNLVADISALSQITTLQYLLIDRNPIRDFAPLDSLTNLVFWVKSNEISELVEIKRQ
jgi:hypothetical protein